MLSTTPEWTRCLRHRIALSSAKNCPANAVFSTNDSRPPNKPNRLFELLTPVAHCNAFASAHPSEAAAMLIAKLIAPMSTNPHRFGNIRALLYGRKVDHSSQVTSHHLVRYGRRDHYLAAIKARVKPSLCPQQLPPPHTRNWSQQALRLNTLAPSTATLPLLKIPASSLPLRIVIAHLP